MMMNDNAGEMLLGFFTSAMEFDALSEMGDNLQSYFRWLWDVVRLAGRIPTVGQSRTVIKFFQGVRQALTVLGEVTH
jgi:hypothetical protein